MILLSSLSLKIPCQSKRSGTEEEDSDSHVTIDCESKLCIYVCAKILPFAADPIPDCARCVSLLPSLMHAHAHTTPPLQTPSKASP